MYRRAYAYARTSTTNIPLEVHLSLRKGHRSRAIAKMATFALTGGGGGKGITHKLNFQSAIAETVASAITGEGTSQPL